MGQLAWKIVESGAEAPATLQETSPGSTAAISASRGRGDIAPQRQDGVDADGIDDPLTNPPPHGLPASSLPLAPPTTAAIPDVAACPMAPGIGGFNIDPPARSVSLLEADVASEKLRAITPGLLPIPPATALEKGYVVPRALRPGAGNIEPPAPNANRLAGDVASEDMRGRQLLHPAFDPQPIQKGWTAMTVWIGRSSFVLSLLAIVAIVGVKLLAFPNGARQVSEVARSMAHEGLASAGSPLRPARLIVVSQKGFVNEPLPIGISLKDDTGNETVTLAGLADGTELSLGTSVGPAGWLLSARDLDKTFVGATKDFIGLMDATVRLQSASDQLLDSKVVRFEWIPKGETEAPLTPALDPPVRASQVQPLDPEE